MKTEIHPKYFASAGVKCSCGAIYSFGSTREGIHIEICATCHPFWTGNEKIIDSAGRVEKFKMRREGATKPKRKPKVVIKATPKVAKNSSMTRVEDTQAESAN